MTYIPNFFIVGAPKSGTTALFEYLRHHPNIYIPPLKEPHYFAKDFINYPSIKTETEYLALFKKCNSNHIAIGEASVWYLYSDVAIANIYKFNPNAKIIAMLRNPIDLAYSMHMQNLFNHNENEQDFEKAWALQNTRALGNKIPRGCRAEQILQYKELASLGRQVERLLSIFPREQVKLIYFDDFIENTKQIYEEVLDFLDLPTDNRKNFPRINESKTHRLKLLGELTQTPPTPFVWISRFLRNNLGIEILGPLNWIRNLNSKPEKRPTLNDNITSQLQQEFAEDIHLLEKLTGRNLTKWLA